MNIANAIYIETINFLTRISARYSRLIAEPVAKLAGEVIDHAEKANGIYPSDGSSGASFARHIFWRYSSFSKKESPPGGSFFAFMNLEMEIGKCYG